MSLRRVTRATHRTPSADELGAWLRFLKKADRCARDPLAQAESFQAAAERAGKKLRLPPGQHSGGADLVALTRLGRTFLTLSAPERQGAAGEIARLAASSRAVVLDAMDRSRAPALRERKDIHG